MATMLHTEPNYLVSAIFLKSELNPNKPRTIDYLKARTEIIVTPFELLEKVIENINIS